MGLPAVVDIHGIFYLRAGTELEEVPSESELDKEPVKASEAEDEEAPAPEKAEA